MGLLEGIFAFVWYDTHTDTLRYARDSFGVKPLYKYEDARFLILSSEIQGILGSGLVGKDIDDSQIYHYLAYRYAEPTQTFFKGIEPVEPCPKKTLPAQHSEALPALASALMKQTVGDVPFGIFLSGGVDSTLLLALLQRQGHTNLPAFTIAHPAKEASFGTSDAHFARLAAKQYGADLHTLEVDSSALEALPAFIDRIDQPIADGAYWLTEMLSAEARKSVKFVFSGAGADELFSGYNRHKAYHFYQRYYGLLMLGYPFLKVLGKVLPTGFAHPYRQYFRLIKKFGQDLSLSPEKTWQNFIRLSALPAPPVGKGMTGILHDQLYYLQHDVLALTDRASMLHALEVRVPYLDAEVVNYAQNIPLAYQLKHGKKWILKKILSDLGGKVYTTRRKEGFGVPIGAWLRAPVGKVYVDILQNPKSILSHYLPARYIQTLVKQHLSYQTDATAELWALLVLEMWLQRQT
ncbi:MAG: hypothetical protein EAY75_04605 [Bacteroidetes bacterium]|nr:MAG: hypothetical protein EAY75_04605 [Bacteroidota bacterium]